MSEPLTSPWGLSHDEVYMGRHVTRAFLNYVAELRLYLEEGRVFDVCPSNVLVGNCAYYTLLATRSPVSTDHAFRGIPVFAKVVEALNTCRCIQNSSHSTSCVRCMCVDSLSEDTCDSPGFFFLPKPRRYGHLGASSFCYIASVCTQVGPIGRCSLMFIYLLSASLTILCPM